MADKAVRNAFSRQIIPSACLVLVVMMINRLTSHGGFDELNELQVVSGLFCSPPFLI